MIARLEQTNYLHDDWKKYFFSSKNSDRSSWAAENSAVLGSSTESQDNGEKGDQEYVWMPYAELEALRHQKVLRQ